MHKSVLLPFCLTALLPVVAGCSSSSSSSPAPPAFNVSGTWTVTIEITSATGPCASTVGLKETQRDVFTVSGNTLTVTHPDNSKTTVLLNGSAAAWKETSVDGTITYVEEGRGTFTATTFTATINWAIRNSANNLGCTGTSRLTGVKTSPAVFDKDPIQRPSASVSYIVYDDNSIEIFEPRPAPAPETRARRWLIDRLPSALDL